MKRSDMSHQAIGIMYGLLAYGAWGILPLYWKLISVVSPIEILAHRIFWSFVYVTILLLLAKNFKKLIVVVSNRKNLLLITLASLIIGFNWYTYIYGVNSNHVVEASMGYYISPLITVLMGIIVLKEKLIPLQILAILSAGIGVIFMSVQYGQVPWIALTLAFTFAVYGLLKKLIKVDSMIGLAVETIILMPIALGYIFYRQINGIGAIGSISLTATILLFLSGIATATPLLWFAKSAERIQLSTMGFLQYVSPTISLILGIIVFKEPFTITHLWGFGFIWAGLILFSISKTNIMEKIRLPLNKEVKRVP